MHRPTGGRRTARHSEATCRASGHRAFVGEPEAGFRRDGSPAPSNVSRSLRRRPIKPRNGPVGRTIRRPPADPVRSPFRAAAHRAGGHRARTARPHGPARAARSTAPSAWWPNRSRIIRSYRAAAGSTGESAGYAPASTEVETATAPSSPGSRNRAYTCAGSAQCASSTRDCAAAARADRGPIRPAQNDGAATACMARPRRLRREQGVRPSRVPS